MVYSTQNVSVISVNYKSGNQAKQQVTIIDAIDSYLGGLTFRLSSGLQIPIPNSQLVIPDYFINAQGTMYFNDSTREIMLDSLKDINANDLPTLGHTFLSSAYMMVNQDASTFILWESKSTTDQHLVAVRSSSACTAPAASSTFAKSTPPSGATFGPPPSRLSGGAIAGAAIGGVAAAALVNRSYPPLQKEKGVVGSTSSDT